MTVEEAKIFYDLLSEVFNDVVVKQKGNSLTVVAKQHNGGKFWLKHGQWLRRNES